MKISYRAKRPNLKDFVEVSFKTQKFDEVVKENGRKKIVLGIEDKKKINHKKLILLIRKIVTLAKTNKIKQLAISPAIFAFSNVKLSDDDLAQLVLTNFEMANYEFNTYKTKPKEGWDVVERVTFFGKISSAFKKGVSQGKIIAQGINVTRELSNTPGGEMTPKFLVKKARNLLKGSNVAIKVLGEKEMKKMKMGGVLSVGQGSQEQSQFIILEYKGGSKSDKPIVLVGKAITFDTGGINLKPSQGGFLNEMHMDMSGGAAVIGTILNVSRLKLKKNIIGLIPAAENMPSGTSYRPGDIIRMMNGKTVEVGNTDAEGRIVLADALTYAKKYKPKIVIDIATLTGSAMIALGSRASAIMTGEEKFHSIFKEFGEKSGDYVWPLPLWEEYEEEVKGQIGDISNIGKFGGIGGAITAAAFLYQFAKDYPWVHIDIAPRMTSVEGEYLAKGAAGAPVRLLVEALKKL